jgi:hypothetical protein
MWKIRHWSTAQNEVDPGSSIRKYTYRSGYEKE